MDVLIWRESVYKNDFKCNRCGRKLFDIKANKPTDNCCIDASKIDDLEHDLWCVCKNLVGKQRVMDDKHFSENEKYDVLNGNINEWLSNKEQEIKERVRAKEEERTKKHLQREVQNLADKVRVSEQMVKRLKADYENKIYLKDKQIQDLTKELKSMESQMRKMEKQMLGRNE